MGTPVDTISYTYGDSSWGDLLTAYDGVSRTYDEVGNLLTDGTWTYTWQNGRELASITYDTVTWNYVYDANGMRTQKSCGTMTYNYVYNGSQLVQMTVSNHTLNFAYDANGIPMTVTHNGTNYYYITNLQGDVTGITDSNGTLVVSYTYDAWGKPLSVTNSNAGVLAFLNPLCYRGYVYDTETGYYYLQSRYYDPEIGRFINADGLVATGQGLLGNNMFTYCLNNPVLMYDSNGLRAVINNRCFGGGSNSNITSDGRGRSDKLLALCMTEVTQLSQEEDFRLSVQYLGKIEKKTDQSLNQAKALLNVAGGIFAGKLISTKFPKLGKLSTIGTSANSIRDIVNMGNDKEIFPDGFYETYKISLSWKATYTFEDRMVYEYHDYEFIICWDAVSFSTPKWQRYDSTNNTSSLVVFN